MVCHDSLGDQHVIDNACHTVHGAFPGVACHRVHGAVNSLPSRRVNVVACGAPRPNPWRSRPFTTSDMCGATPLNLPSCPSPPSSLTHDDEDIPHLVFSPVHLRSHVFCSLPAELHSART